MFPVARYVNVLLATLHEQTCDYVLRWRFLHRSCSLIDKNNLCLRPIPIVGILDEL